VFSRVRHRSQHTRFDFSSLKLLIITFPVDLGNLTLERNLLGIFDGRCDLSTYRFADRQSRSFETAGPNYKQNLRDRFRQCLSLRRAVRAAATEGRTILFHNISPALFSFGAWPGDRTFIVTDWTRKLNETPEKRMSPFWLTRIHAKVLKSARCTICLTDAVKASVINDYGIDPSKVLRAHMPFDIARFAPSDFSVPARPRVLFIGGDLKRKGGNLLLESFPTKLRPYCDLTFVTNASTPAVDGVCFVRNLAYEDARHAELLRNHDLLLLPTRQEGYPQVIGEAAAAGLAVVTTKYALGAPDVVVHGRTGYVCESPEAAIDKASELIKSPAQICSLKEQSRAHMEEHFSKEALAREYFVILDRGGR
jgi:glycosyltransferase involved in cell wall biosynthesis